MELLLLLSLAIGIMAQAPIHKKFEYKHSFRAPSLAQRDGSIPFWTVTGDAIASGEQLRLAPSMRSRKGIAWNKRAMAEADNFEIDAAFKITGQGRIGADGLAIWYTAQQGTLGPVFGANDYWTGMGLFFDSFDNDNQKNNPYIALMMNDGTRSYDHQTDGSQQMLAGCQKAFRNKPFPIHVKVEYMKNVLTVLVSDGMQAIPRYELCIRAENIFLPKNGYFGVSAATGGLADDHDILDFSVYSLFTDQQKVETAAKLPQEEKQKYDEEFERQMKDFEKERQKFKEQHPDKVKPEEEEDVAKFYEDVTQRELRLIYESQTTIYQLMQQMEQKLRDIQQQQNIHTSMLQQQQQQQPGAVAQQPVGGQAQAVAGGFTYQEKSEVLQAIRELTSSIRDMKNYVNEIFTRTYNMEQRSVQAVGSQQDGAVKQYLESIQNDVRQIRAAQIAQGGTAAATDCSNITCLSPTLFLIIIALQSATLLGVLLLKGRQDKAKFY